MAFGAIAIGVLAGCSEQVQHSASDDQPVQKNQPDASGDIPYDDPIQYSDDANAGLGQGVEAAAVTHRRWQVAGNARAYTATAGHLTAKNLGTGAPDASFFYVAYIADDDHGQADPARPLTFIYNGGPGSSTVWLLMGSFGPKRILTDFPNPTSPPSQNRVIDNPETILAQTDMVFVNAVGTGYSEAISPHVNRDFWGVDADANVFAEFIERYLEVNGRQNSPKLLFGESYGTLRSGVLSLVLQNLRVHLNGVILHSSALKIRKFGTIDGFLPSYGTTAWYYKTAAPQYLSMSLVDYAAYLRTFTSEKFEPVRASFWANTLSDTDRRAMCAELQDLTGVASATWYDKGFDLSEGSFRGEALPHGGIGRYDARVVGPGIDPADEANANMPLMFPPYLKDDLKYGTTSPFHALSDVGPFWDWTHRGKSDPDVTVDLAETMTKNPDMKVFSINGYYDLATPFYQTQMDLGSMAIDATLAKNVSYGFYSSGHMTYLDNSQRAAEQGDLAKFYERAAAPASTRRVIARQAAMASVR